MNDSTQWQTTAAFGALDWAKRKTLRHRRQPTGKVIEGLEIDTRL